MRVSRIQTQKELSLALLCRENIPHVSGIPSRPATQASSERGMRHSFGPALVPLRYPDSNHRYTVAEEKPDRSTNWRGVNAGGKRAGSSVLRVRCFGIIVSSFLLCSRAYRVKKLPVSYFSCSFLGSDRISLVGWRAPSCRTVRQLSRRKAGQVKGCEPGSLTPQPLRS